MRLENHCFSKYALFSVYLYTLRKLPTFHFTCMWPVQCTWYLSVALLFLFWLITVRFHCYYTPVADIDCEVSVFPIEKFSIIKHFKTIMVFWHRFGHLKNT